MKFFLALLAAGLFLAGGELDAAERKTAGAALWESVGGCDFFRDPTGVDKTLEPRLENCQPPPDFIPQFSDFPGPDYQGGPYFIYDPENGFLHVDSGPIHDGCGCTNVITAAAYGRSDDYVVIERHTGSCGPDIEMRASVPLEKLLPPEIVPEFFYQPGETPDRTRAYFYLDLEIPRESTDTRLTLKPSFINDVPGSWASLSFSPLSEESHGHYFWDKMFIESKTDWDMYRHSYLAPNRASIDFWSPAVIFHDHAGKPALSPEQTDQVFTHLLNFYKEYRKLKYQSIILGWDRDKGKFFIKEKIEVPPKTFLDFLRGLPYYSPSC